MRVEIYSNKFREKIEQSYPELYWNVLVKYDNHLAVREIYEDVVLTIQPEDLACFLTQVHKNTAYRSLTLNNVTETGVSISIDDDYEEYL